MRATATHIIRRASPTNLSATRSRRDPLIARGSKRPPGKATPTPRARSRQPWRCWAKTHARRLQALSQESRLAPPARLAKGRLDDDVASRPDRRARAAAQPPLGRYPAPQDAAEESRPPAGRDED